MATVRRRNAIDVEEVSIWSSGEGPAHAVGIHDRQAALRPRSGAAGVEFTAACLEWHYGKGPAVPDRIRASRGRQGVRRRRGSSSTSTVGAPMLPTGTMKASSGNRFEREEVHRTVGVQRLLGHEPANIRIPATAGAEKRRAPMARSGKCSTPITGPGMRPGGCRRAVRSISAGAVHEPPESSCRDRYGSSSPNPLGPEDVQRLRGYA